MLGDPEAAAPEFVTAVELDSSSVAAWAGWGRALLMSDHLADAWEPLTRALERDGAYTPALVDLGCLYITEGDLDRAEEHLRMAEELNPFDPVVHYWLGRCHAARGDVALAVGSLRTALEILYPSP
jgi:tetratricopeptide (TPR) repeat protein